MSEIVTETGTVEARTDGRIVGISAVAACLALVFPLTINRLPSAALWGYLALGREIARTHAIPRVDGFSFTAHGQPWETDEWLVGWVFYQIYQAVGLGGLQVFKSLLLLAACGIALTAAVRRTGGGATAAAVAVPLCMLFSQHRYFFDVRAHLLAYLFLAAEAALIAAYVRQPRRTLLIGFPLLAAAWGNCHASVVLSPCLLLLAACGAAFHPQGRGQAPSLLLAAGASLAASICNPIGLPLLLHPFRIVSSTWKSHLLEWKPVLAWEPGQAIPVVAPELLPYLVFLAVTLAAAFLLRRAFQPYELLTLAAFGAFSLTGWRHVPLFCFIAVPAWAVLLQPLASRLPPLRPSLWLAIGGVALVGVGVTAAGTDFAGECMESGMFPRWAAQFMNANPLPDRLFHFYGWGSYLTWKLAPASQVCIDNRAAQVYPPATYDDYLKVAFGRPEGRDILNRWHVLAAVCFSDDRQAEASSRLFEKDPAWVPIYEDDLTRIYVRQSPQTAVLVQRFRSGALVYPASPFRLVQQAKEAMQAGHPVEARNRAAAALQMDPRYAPAALLLGAIYLTQGDSIRGLDWTRRALELEPNLEQAHLNLAVYHARSGHTAEAVAELQRVLAINPTDREALQMLRRLSASAHS